MNYFRCTVGGSGKGNTVTVTCAEEFAGLTITLAKTGKTYTKTCPSTAPYVVTFYGVENGTYTVSGTVDGQTYSETVIVQDISCVLNYGFNWKTWVDTASQLDSSDYDSLDEVLEDEKALRELFLEHACVDYMASLGSSNEDLETVINNDLCAKWINLSDYALDYLYANEVIADLMDEADKYFYGEWALMPQVPTMTSNTAPLGVAFASSENTNTAAYNAFTDASGSLWSSDTNGSAGSYIGYEFVNPISISYAQATNRSDSASAQSIKDCKLQYYDNDNDSWQDASDVVTLPQGGSGVVNANGVYSAKKWRIYGISNYGDARMSLTRLQFYAWAPKGNVPVMTGNSAPYGTASASSSDSDTYAPWKAFDGDDSTGWSDAANQSMMSPYIQYAFTNPICAKKISLAVNSRTSERASSVKVMASNDGTNFTEALNDDTTISSETLIKNYQLDNDNYYRYYRVVFEKTNTLKLGVYVLQFYGRELNVSVPKMTSNTAPYGEAIASSSSTNHYAWHTFDGNDDTLWQTQPAALNNYVRYTFESPMVAKFARIYISYGNNPVKTLKLQGSNDATNWEDLDTIVVPAGSGGLYKNYYLSLDSNAEQFKHYQIFCADTLHVSGSWAISVRTIQFYGLDYSEKEFEVGTTKKWLYDHGVMLEPISNAITSGGTITYGDDFITLDRTNSSANLSIATDNVIDFSNYLKYFSIVDTIKSSNIERIAVSSSRTSGTSGTIASKVVSMVGGNVKDCLDVSSINQSLYPVIFADNVGAFNIKELWLE